jgi:hypothetical protein
MSDATFSPKLVTTSLVAEYRDGPHPTTAEEPASRVAANPRGTRTVSDTKIAALLAMYGKTWNPAKTA